MRSTLFERNLSPSFPGLFHFLGRDEVPRRNRDTTMHGKSNDGLYDHFKHDGRVNGFMDGCNAGGFTQRIE